MPEAGVGIVPIRPELDQRALDGAFSSIGARMQSFGKSMFRSGAIMSAAITAPIVLGFKAAFDAASDMAETVSKSNAVFGESASRIESWSKTAATSFGQSQQQALDAASSFGNMFSQLGIGSEVAAEMSTSMVELASDFASFHNADITSVLVAQQAAFRGEYDALQRFVPTINAAAVEQKALAMTGKEATSELTLQEKALATNALMFENAGDAIGDFDRTAEGAANKQRILRAQLADSAATIGAQLIPIVQKLIGWVQQAVEWFAELGQPMKNVVLVSAALLAALGPIVSLIGALAVAVGFLISPVGLVVLGIAALAAGAIYAYTHFDAFREVVDKVVAWVTSVAIPGVQAFGAELARWGQSVLPQVREAIEHFVSVITAAWKLFGEDILTVVKAAWQHVSETIQNVLKVIQGVIQTALAVINGDWGKAWDGIKKIVDGVWSQMKNIVETGFTLVKATVSAGIAGIVAFFREMPGRVVAALAALGNQLASLATAALGAMRSAVVTTGAAVILWFHNLPGLIMGALGDIAGRTFAVGVAIVRGMINGVASMAGALAAKVKSVVSVSGIDVARSVLGIGSPSKVFFGFGQDTINGFIKGLEDKKQSLEKTMKDIFEKAVGGVSEMLSGFGAIGSERSARESIVGAEQDLRKARERGEDLPLLITEAEERLAEMRADASVKASELRAAERSLADLRQEQADMATTIEKAHRKVQDAELGLLAATNGLLSAGASLLDQGPETVELFVALAEKAGLTRARIDELYGSFMALRDIAAGAMTPLGSVMDWTQPATWRQAGFTEEEVWHLHQLQATGASGAQFATDLDTILARHGRGSHLARLHDGGVYRSPRPGGEGLALLRDREHVFTPEQMASGGAGLTVNVTGSIYADDLVARIRAEMEANAREQRQRARAGWAA